MLRTLASFLSGTRHRSRTRAAYRLTCMATTKGRARARLWLAQVFVIASVAIWPVSYVAGASRGNANAKKADAALHEAQLNAHALRCAGLLPALPADYRPPAGVPPPMTAPCPPRADAAPAGQGGAA